MEKKTATRTLGQVLIGNIFTLENADAQAPKAKKESDAFEASMSRSVVVTFFENVKMYVSHEIDQKRAPKGIPIHFNRTSPVPSADAAKVFDYYGWTRNNPGEKSIPKGHPVRDLWDGLLAWASSQGLDAYFEHDHDGYGREGWPTLCFRPSQAVINEKCEIKMASASITVPESTIKEHGSAQAYLEHLQALASKAASH